MSANVFFFNRPSDNLIAGLNPAITVDVGTEDPDYPTENLGDFSDDKLWQPLLLLEASGAIVIDWGAATAVPLLVIWGNFDEGLPLRVQGNDTNTWGSPSLDVPLTAPAKRANGFTKKIPVLLSGESDFGAYRYTRIEIGDVSGSPAIVNSVPVGLKLWAGGEARTLDRDFDFSPVEHRQSIHTAAHTDTGYGWFYKLGAFLRGLEGSLMLEESADVTAARQFMDWSDEAGPDPVVIILDPDGVDIGPDAYIARFAGTPSVFGEDGLVVRDLASVIAPNEALGWRQFRVAFVEVTAGGPEWT